MWRSVVRTDPGKSLGFRTSRVWKTVNMDMSQLTFADPADPDAGKVAPSFSGGERNRMFLQSNGNFEDVSLVSGTDFREDGRGFAVFDFDRDGYQDLAVTSPGAPRLRILRNRMGEINAPGIDHFVNILLRGGSNSAVSQQEWSSIDAYGAEVVVEVDGKKRRFQHACSEGLSSQNSRWIHVGLGRSEQIDTLEVRWPSGKVIQQKNIKADQWLTISERESGAEDAVE